jgi:protein involved in polysaccharide export with SLBB domain
MRLMSEDMIFIPTVGPLAAVTGSVVRPAIYELKEDVSVLGLIEMAGGFSDVAFRGRIQVERIAGNARQTVFESSAAEARDIMVQAGDVVRVFPYVKDRMVVRVSGAVHREGEYGFREGMTLKDLLSLAGGLKYFAFREEAELTRVSVTGRGPVTERLMVNIEMALADEAGSNIPLRENDYLFVRTIPEWQLYQTVALTGEVRFPGTYTIKKGEKLSSLIERAGGFTGDAYLKGAVFVRESVKELQQQRLDEMIERLERDLFGAAVAETAAATTSEEAKIEELGAEQKRKFIEQLKVVRAQGRMAVRVDRPEALRETQFDIVLKDGDSLYIPQNPSSVQVIGSVFNQTAFVFDSDRDYRDYIDLAGGYTENADKKRVYILKADGTAVRASGGDVSWNSSNSSSSRWGLGGRQTEPGDTVVVPEKLEKIAWMRETKDITQILYQIAVTAGVLIVAF